MEVFDNLQLFDSFSILAHFRTHVNELAAEYGIEIVNEGRNIDNASCDTDRWIIYVPYISSQTSYSTNLHEMGHLLHPKGACVAHDCFEEFETEVWAWKWAKEHAVLWTKEMDNDMISSLLTYAAQLPSGSGQYFQRWREKLKFHSKMVDNYAEI